MSAVTLGVYQVYHISTPHILPSRFLHRLSIGGHSFYLYIFVDFQVPKTTVGSDCFKGFLYHIIGTDTRAPM